MFDRVRLPVAFAHGQTQAFGARAGGARASAGASARAASGAGAAFGARASARAGAAGAALVKLNYDSYELYDSFVRNVNVRL